MNVDEADPVGLKEIGERLGGVRRGTLDSWRTRRVLPEPRWIVGGWPAWHWPDIERWARETGRL